MWSLNNYGIMFQQENGELEYKLVDSISFDFCIKILQQRLLEYYVSRYGNVVLSLTFALK